MNSTSIFLKAHSYVTDGNAKWNKTDGGEFYGFYQITSAVAFDPAIPFPGVYLTDIPAEVQKDIRAIILMAALFVIRTLEALSVHQWGEVK